MSTFTQKSLERQTRAATNGFAGKDRNVSQPLRLADQRPAAVTQRALDQSLNQSAKVQSQIQLQQMFDQGPRVARQRKLAEVLSGPQSAPQPEQPVQQQEAMVEEELLKRQASLEEEEPLQGKLMALQKGEIAEDEEPLQVRSEPMQKEENRTGLPDELKAGVENLSGLSMDDVRVHYNSSAPATVQALAYTQGTEIHVGPGQEQHLAHEAWHVAQQKQGRVSPTMQARGVAINDDTGLEREADVMGGKAAQHPAQRIESSTPVSLTSTVFQRYTAPPSKITVYVEKGSGKIVKVEKNEGEEIGFVFADISDDEALVPEGSVVFLDGKTVVNARFATDATNVRDLGLMKKILPKNIEVKEIEGATEVEEIAPGKEEVGTEETFDPRLKAEGVKLKGSGAKSLISEKFSGFEITFDKEENKSVNQGDIHFKKHGKEVGAETKSQYLKMAKVFGEMGGVESLEAILGNTLIKVDPPGLETRRVFIANAKKMRTFYVWDPLYSSDPFAYAIYYTITHNMKIPLRAVDPKILELFIENNVDLFSMEEEVVAGLLKKDKSKESVASETLAPMDLINRISLEIEGSK